MESKVTVLSGLLLILMPFEGRGEAKAAPGHLTTHTHTHTHTQVMMPMLNLQVNQ